MAGPAGTMRAGVAYDFTSKEAKRLVELGRGELVKGRPGRGSKAVKSKATESAVKPTPGDEE